MNPTRMAVFAALCFGAGALLASRAAREPLRAALTAHGPIPRPENPVAPGLTGIHLRTEDEGFTQVLSALQERSKLKRDYDLYEAVGDLSSSEVAAMIKRAARLPSMARGQVTSALLEHWFEMDVSSAAAWVRADPSLWGYRTWARKAPESLIAEVQSLRFVPARGITLRVAVTAIAGPEPMKQAEYLAAMPVAPARNHALNATLLEWCKGDPAAAFTFAQNNTAGSHRQSIVEAVLDVWAESDPQRASQELVSVLPELAAGLEGNAAIFVVARALSDRDPKAALEWLHQLPDEKCGTRPYIYAASAWAEREPIAALAWCRENGLNASVMGAAVIDAAMFVEPLATVEWIHAIPEVDLRNRWLEAALSSQSELNKAPVNDANAKIFVGLLQKLPLESQERIAYQLGLACGRFGRVLEHVTTWTGRLSDDTLRIAIVEGAMVSKASKWGIPLYDLLPQFPTGPERDGALAGVAALESKKAPAIAALTTTQITNPTARLRSLDRIVSDWAERNPTEARAWLLQDQAMPSDWKQQWLTDPLLQP